MKILIFHVKTCKTQVIECDQIEVGSLGIAYKFPWNNRNKNAFYFKKNGFIQFEPGVIQITIVS